MDNIEVDPCADYPFDMEPNTVIETVKEEPQDSEDTLGTLDFIPAPCLMKVTSGPQLSEDVLHGLAGKWRSP